MFHSSVRDIFIFAGVKKRPSFGIRLSLCVVVVAAIVALITFSDGWQIELFNGPALITSCICSLAAIFPIFCCYRMPLPRMIYSVIAGLMLMLIYMQPAKIFQTVWSAGNSPAILLIKIASWLIIYPLEYLLFLRHVANDSEFLPSTSQVVSLAIAAYVILNSTLLELTLSKSDFMLYIVLCIGQVILCFIILYMQYASYVSYTKLRADDMEKKLHREEIKQFENYKNIIDVMNVKCHDLKHQIREFGMMNNISEYAVEELSKLAELYDSFIKTGNDTIDTILTEKSLRCEREGIQMTCMLDGKALSYISPYDLNSLFGNALSNAIEYLSGIPKDKRWLSVTCDDLKGVLHVRIENYLEEPPVFGEDGLPRTTKSDMNYHGFGMKSMRATAEKYGGNLSVSVKNHSFRLDMLLPKVAESDESRTVKEFE